VDVQAVVTVISQESVTVPFGTFRDAVRMEARMTMLVHLSGKIKIVKGSDTMTVWFARETKVILLPFDKKLELRFQWDL
jgi:hypothetical protein